MGDDDEVLRASDIQHLFLIKDYPRLNALVDEGMATTRLLYRPDNVEWWSTILGFAMYSEDTYMFNYIAERSDLRDVLKYADSNCRNVFQMMDRILGQDHRLETRRRIEVMCEIVLEKWGIDAYSLLRRHPSLRYLADIYRNSFDAQKEAVRATSWCLKTIRSAGGATDGLEETVGKRMQAESTWEYEPKIKRTKY